MKNSIEKIIPRTIKEFASWQISRRNFIKSSLAVGLMSQVAYIQSCKTDTSKISLNDKQLKIIISVQNILFPKDANGPGAYDFNAHHYVGWVLSDKRIALDEKQYIINGIRWLNETAEETHSKKYLKLTKKEQVDLIQLISNSNWGESWLSVMLTFIFEAMISDPIYGFNNDEIGWKWLEHQAGFPRATTELMYDQVFSTVLKNDLNTDAK